MEDLLMKKKLIPAMIAGTLALSGMTFASNVFTSQPAVVSAQEETNFDQGDLSDEEYLNSIIDSFRVAEKVHSSQIDELANTDGSVATQETVLIHDGSVPARQSTTSVGEEQAVFYYYNEGMLFEPLSLHESMIPMMSMTDEDYERKVQELSDSLSEGQLVLNESVAGEVLNPFEISFPEEQTFNSTEKDGSIVRGTIEDYKLTDEESEMLASILPEGTTFNITFEVNPEDESLTLMQETIFPEPEEETEGINPFEDSLITSTVYTITDETVPPLSDFETITYEEYLDLLTEIGLDPVL